MSLLKWVKNFFGGVWGHSLAPHVCVCLSLAPLVRRSHIFETSELVLSQEEGGAGKGRREKERKGEGGESKSDPRDSYQSELMS